MKQDSRMHQKGFGLIGFFVRFFLFAFLSVTVIALFPPYLENFSVRSCLSSLAEDREILVKNEASIKLALLKKLAMSNVKHISMNDIVIEKAQGSIKINVAYVVQTKFIKNVDFLVHFDEVKEVSL